MPHPDTRPRPEIVLEAMRAYQTAHKKPPSIREIMEATHLSSWAVQDALDTLAEENRVMKRATGWRCWVVLV